MRWIWIVVMSLCLSACVNGSAAYYIDGRDHVISVRAEQEYIWSDSVTLTVLAARLPECQRRIALTEIPIADVNVELFASGDAWLLKQGKDVWRVETQGCTQMADAAKAEVGQRIGAFKVQETELVFEAAGAPPGATAAPAAAAASGAAAAPTEAVAAPAPAAAPAASAPAN
jgi:hypothetical protein